ncbi:MAG: DedA family protein [Actinomycetota bacterium]|nr:DedA family protein [Actinomycetota bacterium]
MDRLLLVLEGSHGWWLYVLLGALAFGEAAIFLGVVLPGETALLVGGYLAANGKLSLPVMVVVAVGCAIAGDSVGYEVGRLLGPRLRTSWLGRKVGDRRWGRAEEFLQRHGGKAVFFGRSIALLRALVPTLAGAARMPYTTFLPWNAAGGTVWGGGCVLLGYAFARSLSTVERYLQLSGGVVITIVVVVWLGIHLLRRRRERRRQHTLAE